MNINLDKIAEKSTVLFLIAILVLPRSYLFIKLFFLVFFLMMFFISIQRKRKLYINHKIFVFYGLILMLATIWSLIGYMHGSSIAGISDNFKLWGGWSVCYAIIITIFIQRNNLMFFHKAVVISGILISVINIVGLCDSFYGLNIVPNSIISELDLKIGYHEGYIQITTENITSLFFIVPYLIALQFRKDAKELNTWEVKLSFFLTLLLAAFSGRRALWLCVILTPFLILGLSFFLNSVKQIIKNARRFTYILFFIIVLGFLFVATSNASDNPTLAHLKEAFSAEDERSIQKGFLIDAFYDYPIFGSGFGIGAGYVRSANRVWLYELTYHQMLFNFGLLGTFCVLLIYGSYFYMIIKCLKSYKEKSLIPFCILVGIVSFAIGAYSNPYFGSFDFLI